MNLKRYEGFVDVPGGKVWYIHIGENNTTPLLVLHGGPGSTHFALGSVLDALAYDRPVVFYDQLGSGNSEKPTDSSLWQMDRFIDELTCVREALHLEEIHLLGHSWGTMLAASYLLERKPLGVRSVIFSSPCLSAEIWKKDADRLIAALPAEIQWIIARCEAQGSTDSKEYQEAMKEYNKRYICRIDPRPLILELSKAKSNHDVYETMWGPSEFFPTGNLKHYDCTSQLHNIAAPSLFVCGRYDEATPETTQYYHSLLAGSQVHVFEKSSHTSYLEESDEYLKVVRGFLRKLEETFKN